jgi:hypothetical protein
MHEAGLIIRQAREHGYQVHFVAGDGISNEDFAFIAGPSSDGTLTRLKVGETRAPKLPYGLK